jgi:DNA polymerase III psi subunit
MTTPPAIDATTAQARLQALLELTRSGAVKWSLVSPNELEGSISDQTIRLLLDAEGQVIEARFPATDASRALIIRRKANLQIEFQKQEILKELEQQVNTFFKEKSILKNDQLNDNSVAYLIIILLISIFFLPEAFMRLGEFLYYISRPYDKKPGFKQIYISGSLINIFQLLYAYFFSKHAMSDLFHKLYFLKNSRP